MIEMTSRRSVLGWAVSGGLMASPLAALAAPAGQAAPASDALQGLFPPGRLRLLGCLGSGAPIDTSLRAWEEDRFVPAFTSFAEPYLRRFTRNYVERVEFGDQPAFGMISEYHYDGEAAKMSVRALLATRRIGAMVESRLHDGPVQAQERKYPVDYQQIVTKTIGEPCPPTSLKRRVVLLGRKVDRAQRAFASAVASLAVTIAESAPGLAVSFDIMDSLVPERPADAVIWIDSADGGQIPVEGNLLARVIGVLRVDTRASKFG